MSLKKATRKILQSARNLRSYPSTSKKAVYAGHHRIEGTIIGAARKNAAKLLKSQPKKIRRNIYLGK